MPWWTTALFVRRNEIREEETTGEAQRQGTDAIQQHPFVTANCCAVGWGLSGGRFAVDVNRVYESCPGSRGSWAPKVFPPGWSFVLAVLPEGAGPIYICNTWPAGAQCGAASLHLAHEESAMLLALARSFIFWHALLYSHSVSHRCPSLSSKRRRPQRSMPSADTWTLGIHMSAPGQGGVAGLKVTIKVLGKDLAGLWESWITRWIKTEMLHIQWWIRRLSIWACRGVGENASWLFLWGFESVRLCLVPCCVQRSWRWKTTAERERVSLVVTMSGFETMASPWPELYLDLFQHSHICSVVFAIFLDVFGVFFLRILTCCDGFSRGFEWPSILTADLV